MLVDTHCHIHEADYPLDKEEVAGRARQAGVEKIICVGTNRQSSEAAIEFADRRDGVYAAIGVHPHDTQDGWHSLTTLLGSSADFLRARQHLQPGLDQRPEPLSGPEQNRFQFEGRQAKSSKIVAIGEIGLDYFYSHSPRQVQIAALEAQLQLALDYQLPVIFHVREAFGDFWPIFDNFSGLKGELHSFTDNRTNLDKALARGLLIGINGISVFTKNRDQQAIFASIPLPSLLLETDAPFLTPPPFRGKVNEPAFVRYIAQHQSANRGIDLEAVARATSANATVLFAL